MNAFPDIDVRLVYRAKDKHVRVISAHNWRREGYSLNLLSFQHFVSNFEQVTWRRISKIKS